MIADTSELAPKERLQLPEGTLDAMWSTPTPAAHWHTYAEVLARKVKGRRAMALLGAGESVRDASTPRTPADFGDADDLSRPRRSVRTCSGTSAGRASPGSLPGLVAEAPVCALPFGEHSP